MKKVLMTACISMMLISMAAQADCYSDGVRVGTIQKFSKRGIVYKSWEGELVMEGLKLKTGKHTTGGDVWEFSVLDAKVAADINNYIGTGQPVTLKYCEVFWGVASDTPYRVTSVSVMH